MASLAFRTFVDKENAGSLGVRPVKGQMGGLGKVFSKSNENSLVTPRRALGDVNRDLKAVNNGPVLKPKQLSSVQPLQTKGLQMKSTNKQPLANRSGNIMQKPTVNESIKKRVVCSSKTKVKVEIPSTKPTVEEIEHMHILNDGEDDFEDIWPKSERISTYIKQLVSWRPPCLFGELPDSGDEQDEEEQHQKRMEDVDRILEASLVACSVSNTDVHPSELNLDDLLISEDFEDIPLPNISLDNSIDILENIGPLELQE